MERKSSFLSTMIFSALIAACGGGGNTSGAGAGGAGGENTGGAGAGPSSSGAGAGGGGGAGGQGGSPFVPDPIPVIDAEPPPACAKAAQVNDYFQFLDNLCEEKRFPTDTDRDRPCLIDDPSATITLADGTSVTYEPSSVPVEVDTTALAGLVPPGLNITVILVRRVGGVPHYRYLSDGTHDLPLQPWSTTKFIAAANAAATLRIQSNYAVGLTASTSGHALGDLVTSMALYDNNPHTSNGIGRYFHDIGGRARANDLIHALWLGRPMAETFGGNYGDPSPPLGFTFQEPTGESVSITPDAASGYSNNLSTLTLAEALKRLALHREEPSQRLPGIQWEDLRVLFHGASGSAKYGPTGGLSADTAIYLQSGHDIEYLEKRSHGQWRIFSKLGLGSSWQFVNVGYACLPVLDDQGSAVPGWGREFVIAAHLPTGGATWKERDRILARAYRAIVTRIVDGRL